MHVIFMVMFISLSSEMIRGDESGEKSRGEGRGVATLAHAAEIAAPFLENLKTRVIHVLEFLLSTVTNFQWEQVGLSLFPHKVVTRPAADPSPAEESDLKRGIKRQLTLMEFVTAFGPTISSFDSECFIELKKSGEVFKFKGSSQYKLDFGKFTRHLKSVSSALCMVRYILNYMYGVANTELEREVVSFELGPEDPFSGISDNLMEMLDMLGLDKSPFLKQINKLIEPMEGCTKSMLNFFMVNNRIEHFIKFCDEVAKAREELETYEKDFWLYANYEKAINASFNSCRAGNIPCESLFVPDLMTGKIKRRDVTGSMASGTCKSSSKKDGAPSPLKSREQDNYGKVRDLEEQRKQFWAWYRQNVCSDTIIDLGDLCDSLYSEGSDNFNMFEEIGGLRDQITSFSGGGGAQIHLDVNPAFWADI